MSWRRSYLRDMAATPEELEAAKKAASSGQDGSTWGGVIGTGLGAIAGGLIGGIPTAGAAAIPGAGLGASIGGGLGSAIGGAIGGAAQDDAQKKLDEEAMKRQQVLEDEQAYQEALNKLLAQG